MSLNRVKNYLEKYDLDKKIIELSSSSATVKDAADALNVSEGEIAKSLGFYVDSRPILIVLKGDAKIDNQKFKNTFGKKGKMIPFEEVEKVIGHKVGGVCPFGTEPNVDIYLDVSLKDYKIVYPAAGESNNAVKLTIEELEEASNYREWIDVSK